MAQNVFDDLNLSDRESDNVSLSSVISADLVRNPVQDNENRQQNLMGAFWEEYRADDRAPARRVFLPDIPVTSDNIWTERSDVNTISEVAIGNLRIRVPDWWGLFPATVLAALYGQLRQEIALHNSDGALFVGNEYCTVEDNVLVQIHMSQVRYKEDGTRFVSPQKKFEFRGVTYTFPTEFMGFTNGQLEVMLGQLILQSAILVDGKQFRLCRTRVHPYPWATIKFSGPWDRINIE